MLIQWRASSQRFVAMSSPSSEWDGRPVLGAPLQIVGSDLPARLLTLLLMEPYKEAMKKSQPTPGRPDIDAAVRGGDWAQAMDGERPLAHSTLKQALYWSKIYTEILAMEEKVLLRIEQLMASQSAEARRKVQRTNVPVVVAQAERFRQRLGYWKARVLELDGAEANHPVKTRRVKASVTTNARISSARPIRGHT